MNLIAGIFTGIAASMGLGGGFILIIYLTLISGLSQVQAQAGNLIFFLPTALLSIIIHTKNRLIDWRIIPIIVIAGSFFALIGTYLGNTLDETVLKKLFGGLVLIVGIRELFHGRGNIKAEGKV